MLMLAAGKVPGNRNQQEVPPGAWNQNKGDLGFFNDAWNSEVWALSTPLRVNPSGLERLRVQDNTLLRKCWAGSWQPTLIFCTLLLSFRC